MVITRFWRITLTLIICCITLARFADSRAESGDYRIGEEDLIKINVFDHPELSVDARVSKSGNITFPLLGQLQVAGLTTRDMEQQLVTKLEAGAYVRNPQVSVLITEYQSQKISVMGQVARPGQYALAKENHVLDMLAQAGGVLNEVAADQASLLRHDGTKQAIDLHSLFEGDPRQNPAVSAGDTIYVPKAPVFYVYGQVQRAGVYRLERNMTVYQAISAGGGLTPRGSEHFLKVKRRDSNGVVRNISVKMRDLLQPDDVLTVPEGWF
jgi:polysaccharide export outer membrane protein